MVRGKVLSIMDSWTTSLLPPPPLPPKERRLGRREQDRLWLTFPMIIVRWHDDHGKSDELYRSW